MSQIAKEIKTFTAGEALAVDRRVKLSTSSGTQVEYADQSDSDNFIGWTVEAVASGAMVGVGLKGPGRTFKAVAADTFAVGATLYAADDGKVSDTSSGNTIGTALEAATAANDVVEVLADLGSGSSPGAAAIVNYAAADGGLPFIVKATVTAVGAEDETIIASWPRKALIIDAWMVARDTDAANVTLKQATNAFTDAVAKGATDDAIVRFGKIIAAQDEIAAAAAVIATFSAAGSVDVFIMAVPIA